jgi:competence protein ComEC
VRLRVVELRSAGRVHRLRAPVVLLSPDPVWLDLLPSQRVTAQGRLRPAEPGDDVSAVLSGRGAPSVRSPPSRVQRVAGHLRAGLRRAVDPLPAAERGLLPGLVVGDTSRLDGDLREDFRVVGLSHLTAVSGTNVAIVTGAVLLLARRLGVGVRGSPVLAAVALAGFVVLRAAVASVLRAAVMGLVGLAALSTGNRGLRCRRSRPPCWCWFLVDPDLAAAPGFALSVLATAGLLVLAPRWRRALSRHLPGWLADALAVPAAAQVACGPVVVAISAELGLLSVPANLLAVPAVAPATVIGVSPPPCSRRSWLPAARRWPGSAGCRRPGWCRWPGPERSCPVPRRPGRGARGALLLAALSAGLLLVLRRRPGAGRSRVHGGAVVSAAGLALVGRPGRPRLVPRRLRRRSGRRGRAARGTGPGGARRRRAGPPRGGPLPATAGRAASPLVLLHHDHADHVDGLGRRAARPDVGRCRSARSTSRRSRPVTSPPPPGPPASRVGRPALGERRTVGPLHWEVLAPGRAFVGTSSDPNNSSLVLRLTVGPTTVLLTGDVEPEAQRDLLTRGVDVRADVLKVPHHGSDAQEPAFLDAVGAAVSLTSVGADNTYGHPSARTLSAAAPRSFPHRPARRHRARPPAGALAVVTSR